MLEDRLNLGNMIVWNIIHAHNEVWFTAEHFLIRQELLFQLFIIDYTIVLTTTHQNTSRIVFLDSYNLFRSCSAILHLSSISIAKSSMSNIVQDGIFHLTIRKDIPNFKTIATFFWHFEIWHFTLFKLQIKVIEIEIFLFAFFIKNKVQIVILRQ